MADKNKRPKTQMISFPAEFKPLLDKELDDKGLFTYCELMGQILAKHYGKRPNSAAEVKVREVEEK